MNHEHGLYASFRSLQSETEPGKHRCRISLPLPKERISEMENMDAVREWAQTRTAVSAASIQRKFKVGYPAARRAIDVLQAEARITEDWDASEGGYVVLGRQANTGLQRTAPYWSDDECPIHGRNYQGLCRMCVDAAAKA